MKLEKLLFGALLFVGISAFAQEETEQERECKRMRFLAGEELKIKNYAGATAYYIKGETICGNYDKANYDRMIGTIRNTISGETDKVKKVAYIDTLIAVYERAEAKGFYDQANDLTRATYITQSTKPNRMKADELFARGIAKAGTTSTETQVTLYYMNLYSLYTEVTAEKKPEYKKRLISEYFVLSKIISDAKMSVKTQENINTYFNNAVRSCDELLPELKGFMATLPQDKEMKKATVNNFIMLLETKKCTSSKEYGMLIDTLNALDPSVDGKIAKAKYLRSLNKHNEAISALKEAKSMAAEAEKKEEIEYMILDIQYNEQASYRAAYTTAMGISGSKKGDALRIAAACVAKTANSCGSSTLERKANYLYAAQLADRAGDGSAAARYRAAAPTDSEWFDAGISSIALSCWGVTVSK